MDANAGTWYRVGETYVLPEGTYIYLGFGWYKIAMPDHRRWVS